MEPAEALHGPLAWLLLMMIAGLVTPSGGKLLIGFKPEIYAAALRA